MPKAEGSLQTLMTKQQVNLLLRSSICDDNKKFKDVLCYFKRRIVTKDLAQIQAIDTEIYNIFKTKDALREIVNKAPLEWRPKEYIGEMKRPCELCGSVKSEQKYIIVNIINNKELLVGSSCIFKFKKMDKKLHGISINTLARLSKHNPEKLQRIIEFNELYDSGEEIFKEWSNKYNSFDIIFPKEYDHEFQKILKEGKRYYKKYIDGKSKDSNVKSFQIYISDFEHLHKKCMNYYECKKDNKYVISKQIAKFLKDKGMTTTLEYIQDKEEITKDIAKHVYHHDFVSRFKVDIQIEFKKFNIELKGIDEKNIRFAYKYKNYAIELYNTLENFVCKFSDIFYNIDHFTKDDVTSSLQISKNVTNVEGFIDILDIVLRKTGYYFKIDVELYEKQQVELYKKGSKKFTILNLNHILDGYKECLFLNEVEAKNIILSKISSINYWVDKSDKEKYDIGNISEKFAK